MSSDNSNPLLYPPIPPDELFNAHAYENLVRVVVVRNGVYGLARDGGWVKLEPFGVHSKPIQAEAVEVRKNDDGSIDEIVAENCSVHIEQMSSSDWYVGIDARDGGYWQFWIGARGKKARVEVMHTETSP